RRQPAPVVLLSERVPAHPARLAHLRARLRARLEEAGLAREELSAVLVAVGEACANAVEHAYPDGTGEVTLLLERRGESLVATIGDRGSWRRPGPPGDRGRGTSIMQELSDGFERHTDESGTVVTLRFHSGRRITV
ncbi:MAG: ATP-binding protein, partial [Gaiella sp.]